MPVESVLPVPHPSRVYVSYTCTVSRGVPDAEAAGGARTDGSLTGISALIGAESVIGHAPNILIAPRRLGQ